MWLGVCDRGTWRDGKLQANREIFSGSPPIMLYFTALLALVASCSGYVLPQAAPRAVAARAPAPQALAPELALHDIASLIAEIVDADGERVYGAVEAPGWVPIVGGIAAVGTALLPV